MRNHSLTILLALLPGYCYSAVVEIIFEGNIAEVDSSLSSAINVGDYYTSTLRYDTDLAINTYTTETDAYYDFPTSPVAFTLHTQVGAYTGSSTNGTIYIINDAPYGLDWFQFYSTTSTGFSGDVVAGLEWIQAGATLYDYDSTIFNDLTLSADIPPFSEFETLISSLWFSDGFNVSLARADITSMTVNTVPIPAAIWLFSSGLIGLVGVARRKKV